MEDHVDESNWASLPQGVLQVIGTCYTKRTCLQARLACRSWSVALAPLLKQLRLHVAAGCSITGVKGENAGQLFQQALVRLPCVGSVELVLTKHTTASDVQGALTAIGAQERIQQVFIEELAAEGNSIHWCQRDYSHHLQLSDLQHVRDLRLQTPVTWSLQDIWEQVSGRTSHGTYGKLARLQSLTIRQTSAASHELICNLPVGPSVNAASAGASLSSSAGFREPETIVMHSLKHLTTPLPGQHSEGGAVACTIEHSHNTFMQGLVALAPNLESLTVVGHYQGDCQVFQEFRHLSELHVCVGGLLRSMADLLEEESIITKPITNLRQLHCLDLTGAEGMKPSVKLECLTAMPQLQHLTACLTQSSQDISKVKPDQLRSLCGLHVSPSPELLSQIAAIGQGLTSLTLSTEGKDTLETWPVRQHRRPSTSVQSSLITLSNLHSLSLLSCTHHLAFTVQDPAKVWAAMPQLKCLKLQGIGLGYTRQGQPSSDRSINKTCSIHSTEACVEDEWGQLRSNNHVVLWLNDLPNSLQHLELGRYLIVVAGAGPTSRFGLLNGLETLVLRQCVTVVVVSSPGDDYHVRYGASWLSGMLHGSSDKDTDLSVADCARDMHAVDGRCVSSTAREADESCISSHAIEPCMQDWMLVQAQDPNCAAEPSAGDGMPCDTSVVRVPVWRLLEALAPKCKLQDLQLLDVPVCVADVAALRYVGQQLRHLRICPTAWDEGTHSDWVRLAAGVVRSLADDATAGHFQHMTSLEIDFNVQVGLHEYTLTGLRDVGWPGQDVASEGCGVAALRLLCSSMPGLRQLRFIMDVAHLGRCTLGVGHAVTGAMPAADATSADRGYECTQLHASMDIASHLRGSLCTCNGPWSLGNWQQLRCLDVTLQRPRSLHNHNGGDLTWGHLGRCCACGGGLGIEAVMWYLDQVVPNILPTCQVFFRTPAYQR